ncbi:hypothetical protein FACS189427_01220 [Planctomycetales bacterium]|nr:hypothetical protein FACS189427_01220 [Planctomycetales bacterium]
MEFNISIFIGESQKGSKRTATPCLIGRSKTATFTVAHPAMSRIHCEIHEDNGKLFLRDSGSLNGTIFNGKYVENPVEIPFGSEFSVGELTFRISDIKPNPEKEESDIIGKTTVIESVSPASNHLPQAANISPAVKPSAVSSAEPTPENDGKDAEPVQPIKSKKVSPKEVRIIT